MDVTGLTWFVAVAGLALIALLGGLEVVALIRPISDWTVKNVYGGSPASTDPKAYFAYNQGLAWADVLFWAPIQIAASFGMLWGQRWGFLLALAASVPFIYTAITIFIWDRALRFRTRTFFYWVVVWGMWPVFGVIEGVYAFVRLFEDGARGA